jgi:electron transport complex protein RnfA
LDSGYVQHSVYADNLFYPGDCLLGPNGRAGAKEGIADPSIKSLGVFLPLITTNCAILGVALLVFKGETPMPLDEALVFAVASSIGFGLALTIFAGLREKLELMNIPKALKGTPISLITAGLLSLAFAGFANMVKI